MPATLGSTRLLDRQSEKRADAAYLEALARTPASRILALVDEKPVVVSSDDRTRTSIRWFGDAQLAALSLDQLPLLFLGVDARDGGGRFAVTLTAEEAARSEDLRQATSPAVDLRSLATQGVLEPDDLALLGEAKALAAWHEASAFCGRCGHASTVADGGWKRTCLSCQAHAFPRTDPVVIMLVTDGERCVLAHEPRFPERMFSTIAGFVEPGEDVEGAVRRETREELGLAAGEVSYVASQPWPFPHSLMIGCFAHAAPGELTIDTAELEEARWFTREEARQMLAGRHAHGLWVPGPHAIANVLIRDFAHGIATTGALRGA